MGCCGKSKSTKPKKRKVRIKTTASSRKRAQKTAAISSISKRNNIISDVSNKCPKCNSKVVVVNRMLNGKQHKMVQCTNIGCGHIARR